MQPAYNAYYSQQSGASPAASAEVYGGSSGYYGSNVAAAAASASRVGNVYDNYGGPPPPSAAMAQPSVGAWGSPYQNAAPQGNGGATRAGGAEALASAPGYYNGVSALSTATSYPTPYADARGSTAAAAAANPVGTGYPNSGGGPQTFAAPTTSHPSHPPQPYTPLPSQPSPVRYHDSAPPTAPMAAPPAMNTTDENGLRWTWSCYPTTPKVPSKESATAATVATPEMVIPMSCMYTPLYPIDASHLVIGGAMEELCCPNCRAFCSLHNQYEVRRFWTCRCCKRRNAFQPTSAITEQHPALLYETVEFVLDSPSSSSVPTFIFVVDRCISAVEMASLRTSLLESLRQIPRNALVGFITFAATVTVWELGTDVRLPIRNCYVLRGNKANAASSLQSMLQVLEKHPVRGRLLARLCDAEPVLVSLIEELEEDNSVVPSSKRPLRATSTAVEAATYLMEALAPPLPPPSQTNSQDPKQQPQPSLRSSTTGTGTSNSSAQAFTRMGRILLFTGGPCTRGPGAVTSTDKGDMMRFHRDIIEGNTPFYEAAFCFYNELEPRLTMVNACLDVFAQSLDQVGVMEMRRCIDGTGGTLIVDDEAIDVMFLESLQRYWERCDLRVGTETKPEEPPQQQNYGAGCGFAVHIEVNTSMGTSLRGALGPCNVDVEANKRGPARATSSLPVGCGGTARWCVSTLDKGTTLAFLFDTATAEGQQAAAAAAEEEQGKRFIQFVTRYTTPRGEQRVRVTSVLQPVAPPTAPPEFYTKSSAFDQACAATIVARLAVSILEKHPAKWDEAKRWLDTLLVRFVRRYAAFTPGQPQSLQLDPCLSLFPSFLYNLRRSEYFMVLNISPDETTFKRHWLMRESVDNAMLMIQPTLDAYDMERPYATAVQLDSGSLRHDNIVLMDAYFNVHIMWGSTIYQWIEAGYHESPDYANFAELLEVAEQDAQAILAYRYPYPRFSRTDADGSEARHVKTRVNPATNYHSAEPQYGAVGQGGAPDQGEVIYTDDASIMTFITSLKKAVVGVERK